MEKKQTAFRLNANLLERLKEQAKRANRSLSNYVECILMDSVYNEPNETTITAIKEARSGKHAGVVDISSTEAFIKSCEEGRSYVKVPNTKRILKGIETSLKSWKNYLEF